MRIEPHFTDLSAPSPATGRDLVPFAPPGAPVATGPARTVETPETSAARSRLREASGSIDIRCASPRQMADLGLDLHLSGYLEWEEYAMVAFQPELHPDFDRTIGALTGERANPDRPRDQVAVWEERLAFETRHPARDPTVRARTARIVHTLRAIDRPFDLVA